MLLEFGELLKACTWLRHVPAGLTHMSCPIADEAVSKLSRTGIFSWKNNFSSLLQTFLNSQFFVFVHTLREILSPLKLIANLLLTSVGPGFHPLINILNMAVEGHWWNIRSFYVFMLYLQVFLWLKVSCKLNEMKNQKDYIRGKRRKINIPFPKNVLTPWSWQH